MGAVLALPWVVDPPEPAGLVRVQRAPARYAGIDFKPPQSVARAAARGLELREQFGRGGTAVGVARARDLKNRRKLSPETIGRMVSYFARHESDREADGWGNPANPSAGWIAWLLWGGDPGRAWARRVKREMDRADDAERSEKARGLMDWLCAVDRARQARAPSDRAAAWRGYVRALHAPAERRLAGLWADYLAGAAERIAGRLETVLGQTRTVRRDLSDAELAAILFEQEEQRLAYDIVEDGFSVLFETGFRSSALAIGEPLEWSPVLDPTTIRLGREIVAVSDVTRDRVAGLIRTGLTEGQTVADMQAALILDAGFQPSRALRIARTESTKGLSEGAHLGYEAAANIGVRLRQEWLSARTRATRESHWNPAGIPHLDGQEVGIGESFVVPSGEHKGDRGRWPGDFTAAGEVVNCICTTIPKVQD